MLRFIAIALFVVVAKVGSAQTPGTMPPPDPMIGAWRLNLEKSNYATPAPKSMTIMISPATRGYAFTVDAIGPDGQAQRWGFTSAFDGSETEVSGNPSIDTVIATSTGNGGIVRYKKAGNVITTTTSTVSDEGRTLTVTIKIPIAPGKDVTSVAVYERQ